MTPVPPILIPDDFNAATYFIDRHIQEGRAETTAVECQDTRISYGQLFELVNLFDNRLRDPSWQPTLVFYMGYAMSAPPASPRLRHLLRHSEKLHPRQVIEHLANGRTRDILAG
jgi:hypothetical protein